AVGRSLSGEGSRGELELDGRAGWADDALQNAAAGASQFRLPGVAGGGPAAVQQALGDGEHFALDLPGTDPGGVVAPAGVVAVVAEADLPGRLAPVQLP